MYVAREVSERFTAAARRRARGRSPSATPSDPGTQVGPLASARRLEHVDELVEEAVAQGATLHCGGPVSPEGCDGAFYAPAVITGVTPEMRLMREPVDGPVLAIMTVDSVEQAIALANDSDFGLGASVWTRDRYRGLRIARELHAGMVWLNDHLPSPAVSRGPWGAAAGGGLGRMLGRGRAAGVRAGEADHLEPPGLRGLWWGPYDQALERRARRARRAQGRDSDRERPTASGAWREWRPGAGAASVGSRAGRWMPASHASAATARRARGAWRRRTATLWDARPGLCRQGVRLSAAQRNLRPDRACRGCSTPPSTSPA